MTDAITYDDIYELLRAEKNSADLEPLDAEYLSKVKDYLLAKRKLLESQKGGMFSGLKERAKIMSEIENVRGALKDLFEKRERKVINRSLYTIRTDLKMKDTTHMLRNERELYDALLQILEQSKLAFSTLISENDGDSDSSGADAVFSSLKKDESLLDSVSTLKIAPKPAFNPTSELRTQLEPAITPTPIPAPSVTASPLSKTKGFGASQKPKVFDTSEARPEVTESNGIPLTFLKAVPELVDAELQRHGPFNEGDIASLPSELASILVAQGKAKTE